jgi:hypothetical protein
MTPPRAGWRLHPRRDSGDCARPFLAIPQATQDLSGAPHGTPRDALRHSLGLERPRVGLTLRMHQRISAVAAKDGGLSGVTGPEEDSELALLR